MKAKVKVLKVENKSGLSKKTGNDYDLDFLHVLDLDSVDKFSVMVDKAAAQVLRDSVGKEGVLELGVDAKTEKLTYVGFKAAA